MLETQRRWYIPAPTVLGWHIGFWNLIGALGFTLCGAFGFASSNEVYETALTWSTFVGSWAFLVSQSHFSLVSLYISNLAWLQEEFALVLAYSLVQRAQGEEDMRKPGSFGGNDPILDRVIRRHYELFTLQSNEMKLYENC